MIKGLVALKSDVVGAIAIGKLGKLFEKISEAWNCDALYKKIGEEDIPQCIYSEWKCCECKYEGNCSWNTKELEMVLDSRIRPYEREIWMSADNVLPLVVYYPSAKLAFLIAPLDCKRGKRKVKGVVETNSYDEHVSKYRAD